MNTMLKRIFLPTNTISALDLYSRIEDLIGVKEATPKLYAHYLLALQDIPFGSLLDVGCGSGDFILSIQNAFADVAFRGIDLSPQMAARAREKGIDAEAIDLCDEEGRYDVITAVFDVLNYLTLPQLERFGKCLREHLSDGGYFLCDVNTLYGFEEVAVGIFSAEDATRFVTIEGDFAAGEYRSDFVLFERGSDNCWRREDAQIRQYYHDSNVLDRALGLERVSTESVGLFGEEIDKNFIIYKKN